MNLPFLRMPKEYDVGKHEISGVFSPQDNNYQSVTDIVVVDIVSVKPEQAAPPVVRNYGIYGDRLNQIRFLEGKYKIQKRGKSSKEVLSGKMAANH